MHRLAADRRCFGQLTAEETRLSAVAQVQPAANHWSTMVSDMNSTTRKEVFVDKTRTSCLT